MRPVIDAHKFNIDQFYRARYQGQLLNYNDMMRRGGQANAVYEVHVIQSIQLKYGHMDKNEESEKL